MQFKIKMGIPEVEALWQDICYKFENNRLNENELRFFKKLIKTLKLLEQNPRHNSLSSHEIKSLSNRFGEKVWQSYIENNIPSAGRIFWIYGPKKNEITILGIESHPEDKKNKGYEKVRLSFKSQ
jgi:hypothetical protein